MTMEMKLDVEPENFLEALVNDEMDPVENLTEFWRELGKHLAAGRFHDDTMDVIGTNMSHNALRTLSTALRRIADGIDSGLGD